MPLLLPLPRDRMARRLIQLYLGLALYGFSTALLVEGSLGLGPWDVLHKGLAERSGFSIGVCTIGVGVLVLLLWIPMRQRPGLGTVSNAILIGVGVDISLHLLPGPEEWPWQALFVVAGVVLNGMATGLYIGAGMGPGPRDGLMTGLAARGRSIRLVRTGIEVSVLVVGWLLGGSVGIGTVAYALGIGPLSHVFIPMFTVGDAVPATPPDVHPSIG